MDTSNRNLVRRPEMLDLIAGFLHYRCLSDLHIADQRVLYFIIKNIPADNYSLADWEDTYQYLTGQKKEFNDARKARERLLNKMRYESEVRDAIGKREGKAIILKAAFCGKNDPKCDHYEKSIMIMAEQMSISVEISHFSDAKELMREILNVRNEPDMVVINTNASSIEMIETVSKLRTKPYYFTGEILVILKQSDYYIRFIETQRTHVIVNGDTDYFKAYHILKRTLIHALTQYNEQVLALC